MRSDGRHALRRQDSLLFGHAPLRFMPAEAAMLRRCLRRHLMDCLARRTRAEKLTRAREGSPGTLNPAWCTWSEFGSRKLTPWRVRERLCCDRENLFRAGGHV